MRITLPKPSWRLGQTAHIAQIITPIYQRIQGDKPSPPPQVPKPMQPKVD